MLASLLITVVFASVKVQTRAEAEEESKWPILDEIWHVVDPLGEEGPFPSNHLILPILSHLHRHSAHWDLNEAWYELEVVYRCDLISSETMITALDSFPPENQDVIVRVLRILPKHTLLSKYTVSLSGYNLIEAQYLIHNLALPELDGNLRLLELHLRYAPTLSKVDLALQLYPQHPLDIPAMIGAIPDPNLLDYAIEQLKDNIPTMPQLMLNLSLAENN